MSDKGILTKEQEKNLAEIIDKAIKAKGLLELIDGYAAKVVVTVIDDNVIDKLNLSDDFKVKLGELIDAAIAENIALSEEIASELLNQLVDIPGLDEDAEAVIFEGAVKFIVGAVISWVKKDE